MFGLFRAGGFAAASLVLSASVMGVGHAQIVPLATSSPTITAPASAAFAPIFEESPQLVLPVQSAPTAPTTPTVVSLPEIAPAPAVPPAPAAPVPAAAVPAVAVSAPGKPLERATLAQLVTQHRSSATPTRELECLAKGCAAHEGR